MANENANSKFLFRVLYYICQTHYSLLIARPHACLLSPSVTIRRTYSSSPSIGRLKMCFYNNQKTYFAFPWKFCLPTNGFIMHNVSGGKKNTNLFYHRKCYGFLNIFCTIGFWYRFYVLTRYTIRKSRFNKIVSN